MFILSKEDREFLIKHVDNAEKLIDAQDHDELTTEMEYAMMRKGYDKDWFPNAFGKRIEEIYDSINASVREHREKNT